MEPQLAFLLYVNRSGSTFLASKLADVPGIAMTIEANFVSLMIEHGFQLDSDKDIDRFIEILTVDDHFREWNIDNETLRTRLGALPRPAGVEEVTRAILDIRFEGTEPQCIVLKDPRAKIHIERVRKAFRAPKFIHVVRDPRAVAGSQMTSVSSKGDVMVTDPVTAAQKWLHFVRKIHAQAGPDLIELRYEDMIADLEAVVTQVLAFLGVSAAPGSVTAGKSSYFDAIPDSQKHVHGKVKDGAPKKDRIAGWRKELKPTDIVLIERQCAEEMKRLGYEPVGGREIKASPLSVLGRGLQSYAIGKLAYVRRAARMFATPNVFFSRLRAKYYEYN